MFNLKPDIFFIKRSCGKEKRILYTVNWRVKKLQRISNGSKKDETDNEKTTTTAQIIGAEEKQSKQNSNKQSWTGTLAYYKIWIVENPF